MQTPAEIDFQGMDPSPDVRAAIENHIAQLEDRFGRITAGRVVLKAPSGRHRTGGLYEIAVRLSLPDGREVNVGHVRQDDERFADLNYALNDTFKRARRQLQDNAREMQGQVKESSGSPIGTVAELDPLGQFGFIKTDDGREIYFHRNSVLADGFAQLGVGARVSFAEEMGDKGPQASTVKPLSKHSMKV
jgi:cold shock CspA family protein